MNRVLRTLRLLPVLIALTVRASDPPRFGEVVDLVRSNLAGISEVELNDAVVNGLLEQLQPRVFLPYEHPCRHGHLGGPARPRQPYERVRVGLRLPAGGPGRRRPRGGGAGGLGRRLCHELLEEAWSWTSGSPGGGFPCGGTGGGWTSSSAKPSPCWTGGRPGGRHRQDQCGEPPPRGRREPQTRSAAEALAAAIQETRSGLVIGRPTAGEAAIFREIPLSTGQRLRVAVAPVKAGRWRPDRAPTGLAPDITITAPAADERKHFDDPYRASPGSGARTNASRLPRLTEADLVRLHREGIDAAAARLRRPEAQSAPQVTDPALLRALDLLRAWPSWNRAVHLRPAAPPVAVAKKPGLTNRRRRTAST